MGELFKTFGPWAFVLGGMGVLLKYLVTDKLNAIMKKLAMVDAHETDIALIKQALQMNGCMSFNPKCRSKGDE